MNLLSIAPTPPYAALLFDCDGTLADTLPIHYKAWSEALQKFGVEISWEWYCSRAGISTVELVQLLNNTFGYQMDIDQVKFEKHKQYKQRLHEVEAIQPVVDVALSHHGKVPIALVSGGARDIVETTLEAIGLANCFETILTIEDVTRGKPAPDLFLLAAQRLNVDPEACIVYEDSDAGLEAARRAGMRGIDVRLLANSVP